MESGDALDTGAAPLRYAGFWPRLGAHALDALIFLPLYPVHSWLRNHYRMYYVYVLVWSLMISVFYRVYLVRRFGGTPGKCWVGVQIRKLNGASIGYREAILRILPDALLEFPYSCVGAYGALQLTDSQYLAFDAHKRVHAVFGFSPILEYSLMGALSIWMLADTIVFFSNDKRRALHDFIAGTVVVCTTYKGGSKPVPESPQPPAAEC
jgi:uncharacterized RDD family membrane protein YckC